MAACLLGLYANPAYLLVDARTTLKEVHGLRKTLLYVFSPEKFVLFCLFNVLGDGLMNGLAGGVFLLDLTAIAALVVAIVPAEPFPPALLVGYSLTALSGVVMILAVVGAIVEEQTKFFSKLRDKFQECARPRARLS